MNQKITFKGAHKMSSSKTAVPPPVDESPLLLPHQVECVLSPLVVFSVLDHWMRRSEGQDRVIGTLLGANNDGQLEITNCFPVPHTEGETVGIDMDFHKTMYGLHRQGKYCLRVHEGG